MDSIRCRVLMAVKNGCCTLSQIQFFLQNNGMPILKNRQISSALQGLKKENRVKSWPWEYIASHNNAVETTGAK